jgi:hypothetical protein
LTNDPRDDALIDIALAVANGGDVSWNDVRAQLTTDDLAVVDALQTVSRLALARRPPSDAAPFTPTRWGHLSILGVSRRGDETQYAARDEAFGREVVLTLIGPLEGDIVRTEQALQRARLRTRIAHPHLAAVYGADYAQDRVGYWSEHVAGPSLAEIVAGGGRFSVGEACQIVVAMCGAVAAVHTAGLSDGGVTASNIVKAGERFVLLASVCWRVDGDARPPCATENDITDLGALLYFLLTGIHVEKAADPVSVADSLHRVRPDVRPALVTVIGTCFSGQPTSRFATATELEQAMTAAMSDRPVTAEWVIGFVVTALVVLLLLWYAYVVR